MQEHSAKRSPVRPPGEMVYAVEAANGMLVWVPQSRLADWLKGQEEIRRGTYKAQPQEIETLLSAIRG